MLTLTGKVMCGMYKEFAEDLLSVHEQQAQFFKKYKINRCQKNRVLNTLLYHGRSFRVSGLTNTGKTEKTYPPSYEDLDAEITYLLIRTFKPKSIVEISPASGWSSSWILSALRDNGFGFLTSFDIEEMAPKMVPSDLAKNRWNFVLGDVKQQIDKIPGTMDYLFMDSDHSASFAQWYFNSVFPLVKSGSPVSIHDIWLKNLNAYGEIKEVLNWLQEKNIEYVSPSSYAPRSIRNEVLTVRKEIGLNDFIHFSKVNPSVFFLMPSK